MRLRVYALQVVFTKTNIYYVLLLKYVFRRVLFNAQIFWEVVSLMTFLPSLRLIIKSFFSYIKKKAKCIAQNPFKDFCHLLRSVLVPRACSSSFFLHRVWPPSHWRH